MVRVLLDNLLCLLLVGGQRGKFEVGWVEYE